jgi:hypothetical protein
MSLTKKTFAELSKDYHNGYIPYGILLNTTEWRNKRQEILQRDQLKCTSCGKHDTMTLYTDRKIYVWWGKEKPHFIKHPNGTLEEFDIPEMVVAPKQYYLNIHHKYYIKNKLPWEYDNDVLITLCNWCHEELHKNERIKVYTENGIELENLTPCNRCEGAGWLPHYDHIESGICFYCRGAKFVELINLKIQ